MSARGNRHVHRALHRTRRAMEAHSETCEWPDGCGQPSRWYYTTLAGRYSLCDSHTPLEFRTDPIPVEGADAPTEGR